MEVLSDIVVRLEQLWPPAPEAISRAADRNSGLVLGDVDQPIGRLLFAVAPSPEAANEAADASADLLVCLLPLPQLDTLTNLTPAGRTVRALIGSETGLYIIGENAERAELSPSHVLAETIDLMEIRPLVAEEAESLAMLVVYVPEEESEKLRLALASAGAGAIGDYTGCAWSVTGAGEFTPMSGANPTVGQLGQHEIVEERRLEMVVPLSLIDAVTDALREAHPYEEPAFSFVVTHAVKTAVGRGRVGRLEEAVPVAELVMTLRSMLPGGPVRVTNTDRSVRTIAVIAGAGDVQAALDAGADVLIASDLSHAEVIRAQTAGLVLIDVPLPSLLWPWLPVPARTLAAQTDGELDTIVSTRLGATWKDVSP